MYTLELDQIPDCFVHSLILVRDKVWQQESGTAVSPFYMWTLLFGPVLILILRRQFLLCVRSYKFTGLDTELFLETLAEV